MDKTALIAGDYRLFQGTPAWELAKAVEDDDIDKINEIAVKQPKTLDYKDSKYGNTVLFLTIINQQIKPFKALLANKANINIHNNYDGTSPLIKACMYKRYSEEFAKILIEKGANVNDVEVGKRRKGNSTRFTPLMAASREGNLDLVELLISNNADINYKNEYGQTALSNCVMQKRYEVALFLLERGADYKQPIFYRFGDSFPYKPEENKPMYLADVLKEDVSDLDSNTNKYKLRITDFLKHKGIKL